MVASTSGSCDGRHFAMQVATRLAVEVCHVVEADMLCRSVLAVMPMVLDVGCAVGILAVCAAAPSVAAVARQDRPAAPPRHPLHSLPVRLSLRSLADLYARVAFHTTMRNH